MPKSILMYPDAGTLAGEDLLYLVKGAGGSDRDRKVNLGLIREFMSERGADLEVVNIDNTSPGPLAVQTVASRDLVLLIQGDHTMVTELQIAAEVPTGAVLTMYNGSTGPMATVAGNANGFPYNCDPPVGTFARSEVVELTHGPSGWMCQHPMDANSVRSALASIGQVLDDYDARLDTLEAFTTAAPALVNFAEAFGDPLINVDNGVDFLLGTLPAGSWIVDGAVRYGVSEGTEVTHTLAQFVTKNPSTGTVIGSGRPACGSPSTFRAHVGMPMNGVTLPRTILSNSQDVNLYIRFECFGTKTSQGTEPICIHHALATHQPT